MFDITNYGVINIFSIDFSIGYDSFENNYTLALFSAESK